jgi:hypothetical protein
MIVYLFEKYSKKNKINQLWINLYLESKRLQSIS